MKPSRESFDPKILFDYDEDDEKAFTNIVSDADAIDRYGKPINQQYLADLMINTEVLKPHEETQQTANAICSTIDSNGNIIGTFDENSVLN